MSTIRLEASVSPEDLLHAIEKLGPAELERFASQVFALVANRRAPSLSEQESQLLQEINQGVPAEMSERYAALIERRREETLTPEEHDELLRLGDQIEALDAKRVERLAKLADLRGMSLEAVMASLGIRAHAAQ